ncbi:MAG: GAF domain-containing protein [Acidobacteriia bacterium]|nr:GAF domain-containing protein [Terriglobia bacterium]
MSEIRVPRGIGIAGLVALTGETVNIKDAYQDPRFNPEVDRRTGYHTRTILCMPLRNETGEIIGVMQVLNKKEGVFTEEDEQFLNALGSQTAIALENSRLFEEVRFMKNYNDSILRTMETGVVTLDPDGHVAYANGAAQKIFVGEAAIQPGMRYQKFFREELNPGLADGINQALQEGQSFTAYDFQYRPGEEEAHNINVHALPLATEKGKHLGVVIIADDITQEQRLMSTLCRYVTRQVAEEILKDRDRLKLGGNRSTVAVLFSDIRNFTTISEQSSAEDVVAMLNDYFTRMLDPVFLYEGTLDKFIGDAIMAVFGAPIPFENDAERAVRAALEMRRALKRYNEDRLARGLPPIDNGIGITKGEAISGNIGSEQRMDYTVIGDTVNTASRLEGLTKMYPYKILVNEQVYNEIKQKIPCVDLGFAHVKGKEGDVHIYGIADPIDEIPVA